MDITKSIIVFSISLFAGFMGGQVGGGGLLTLPVLLLIGLNPLIALGTNRFSGVFVNLGGFLGFRKKHKLKRTHFFTIGIIAIIGGFFGGLIVFILPIDQLLLKKIILSVLFLLALLMYLKKDLGVIEGVFSFSKKKYFIMLCLLFLVAIYGGVLGAGTATLFAAVFVFNKQSYLQSMAYSLYLAFCVSLVSLMIFWFHNSIDYYYGTLQAVSGLIGSYYGSKFAIKKGNKWLRILILAAIILLIAKLGLEMI